MTNQLGAGAIDYSDDPILPPWYVPGWTSQNENNFLAPKAALPFSNLPGNLSYCQVTANYNSADNDQIGGYLTFQQSDNLLLQDPNGTYFRLPKRLVGTIPSPSQNALASNWVGSGKVYIQFGQLSVTLMTNDQPNATVTILEDANEAAEQGFTQPTTWYYLVKEYIGISSMQYQIIVPSSMAPGPVDINTLIVPGTMVYNNDWNRGI